MDSANGHRAEPLSDDILLDIFEFGAQRDPGLALKLTHVCSHWRSICLASSFLWSNICVVNDFSTYPSVAATSRATWYGSPTKSQGVSYPEFHQLQYYLHHSRTRSLDVFVDTRMPHRVARNDEATEYGYEAYHHRTRMIAIFLSRHSHRIRSLRFRSDTYNGASVFFESLQGARTLPASEPGSPVEDLMPQQAWSQLEDCEFQWTGAVEAFPQISTELRNDFTLSLLEDTTPGFTFGSQLGNSATLLSDSASPIIPTAPLLLPKLRKLSIRGLSIDWDFFAPSDLEELHLSEMHDQIKPSFRHLKVILTASQTTLRTLSLVDVCVGLDPYDSDEDDEPKELELSMLQTLVLGYVDPYNLYPLATSFKFPALENLTIKNVGGRRFQNTVDGFLTPEEIRYFTTTRALFTAISINWPLRNLDFLTLVDVQFLYDNIGMPPNPVLRMQEVETIFEEETRDDITGDLFAMKMLLPFNFWQKCGNLKNLVLIRPDPATVYALYCPAPAFMSFVKEQEARDLQAEDLFDGSWLKSPSGALFKVPVAKLEGLWVLGIYKEDTREFFCRREAILSLVIGGKKGSRTKYRVPSGPA
ncbi:hypothetical protein BDN72DRAFT_847544 [Pluteus cervinus]|uniref:Uncharacterized protein n=2 Tax=Pluteus cervinus TaxID=181527 RepID=A0ACD3A2Z8_9AGAR|nr:hypothetical protein BDN72DRAFT_850949 [Pluteus cervinus]TFK63500.1 hypothetical protein BDN72DRAFT_847544 [Pluteus cervinus]